MNKSDALRVQRQMEKKCIQVDKMITVSFNYKNRGTMIDCIKCIKHLDIDTAIKRYKEDMPTTHPRWVSRKKEILNELKRTREELTEAKQYHGSHRVSESGESGEGSSKR